MVVVLCTVESKLSGRVKIEEKHKTMAAPQQKGERRMERQITSPTRTEKKNQIQSDKSTRTTRRRPRDRKNRCLGDSLREETMMY